MNKVKLVIFDVNETTFSLNELKNRFIKKKINPNLVETWFLSVLKEGFATSNINFFVDFKTIARNQLKKIIHKHGFAMKNDFVDFFF